MRMFELALLDTNILVYYHQALSKFHSQSKNLLNRSLEEQVLMIFFGRARFLTI